MTKKDKVTVDDIIGIVHTDEPTDSVDEVRKLRGRENKTEKRFTYMEQFNGFCDVYDTGKILSCMRLEYVDKTVNLLNEQHETIQVLKASNGEMEDYLARLEEEKKQLKKDCTVLIYHNQEYRKENEQLKDRIDNYNTAFKKLQDLTERKINENEQLKEDKQALIDFIRKEFPKSHKHILEGFE